MKIVVTDAKTVTNGDISLEFLKKYGDVKIYELTDASETADRIADADMVIVNKTVLDRNNMKDAKNLRYIGLFATGYNNIDVEYAKERGIAVCNAGSYSNNAVAQQVFSYILAHSNRTGDYDAFVRAGGWKKSETFSPFVFPLTELDGKVIGIVGYGNIGRKVAEIAKVFGMKVLAYSRTPKEEKDVRFCSFEELLTESDYVTVHCPLNEESKGMFDAQSFAKMKKSAYFINTARGGVTDEAALAEAVKNGVIAGAAVDVLTAEPMSEDCPLFNIENLTVTPHIAWAPTETRTRLMGIIEDNIRSFLEGKPKNNVAK